MSVAGRSMIRGWVVNADKVEMDISNLLLYLTIWANLAFCSGHALKFFLWKMNLGKLNPILNPGQVLAT